MAYAWFGGGAVYLAASDVEARRPRIELSAGAAASRACAAAAAGAAREKWQSCGGVAARRYNIVEGEHALWRGVSDPYKHTIRAFLVHFHTLVLRQSSARFSFQNGSVGAPPRAAHAVRAVHATRSCCALPEPHVGRVGHIEVHAQRTWQHCACVERMFA